MILLVWVSVAGSNTSERLFPVQVDSLATSEKERKDQEETKQDQPLVFGEYSPFYVNILDLVELEASIFEVDYHAFRNACWTRDCAIQCYVESMYWNSRDSLVAEIKCFHKIYGLINLFSNIIVLKEKK